MDLLEDKLYTVEEYFSMVEESDHKLEYHYGKIYAMAGGTSNHSIISVNTIFRLSEKLDNKDCVVYNSDMALELAKDKQYVYPDVMVVCGDREFSTSKQLRVKNPILIVEVLSEATIEYDRSTKFKYYRNLPSLKEYVMINAEKPAVESFFRESEGLWRISSAIGLEESIHLYSLDIDIPMTQIYAKAQDLGDPYKGILKDE